MQHANRCRQKVNIQQFRSNRPQAESFLNRFFSFLSEQCRPSPHINPVCLHLHSYRINQICSSSSRTHCTDHQLNICYPDHKQFANAKRQAAVGRSVGRSVGRNKTNLNSLLFAIYILKIVKNNNKRDATGRDEQ